FHLSTPITAKASRFLARIDDRVLLMFRPELSVPGWAKHRPLFGQRRAAGEFGEGGIADVLEVRDADLAGVETGARHIAQPGKKSDALAERGIALDIFAIGKKVQNFFLLCGGAIEEEVFVAVGAEIVQPHQSASQMRLVVLVFAREEIDELRRAGLDGAARNLVLGNNGITKKGHSAELVRGKILRRVIPRQRGSLL